MPVAPQLSALFALLRDEAIVPGLSDLPIVGTALDALPELLDFDELQDEIAAALAAVDDLADPAAQATALAEALDDLDSVTATATGSVVDITITANASESISVSGGALSLGGSAVGLDASADFEGSVAVDLDLGLTFDVATDTLEVVLDPDDELELSIEVAADVVASGSLGFLTVELTDQQTEPELAMTAAFDITGFDPADVNVTYSGAAQLRLELLTQVLDGLLPNFFATLEIDWDPTAPDTAPTVGFGDVGVEVGSLVAQIERVLSPLTDILFDGIIGKIIDTITTPIPVIDDGLRLSGLIGLFDTIPTSGDGFFNILDGIGLYLEANGQDDAVDALSAFAQAIGVLRQLNELAENDDRVSLGSFDVGSGGAVGGFNVAEIDGLSPLEFLGELTGAAEIFTQAIDAVKGVIEGGSASLSDTDLSDDSGLSFPLFETPERVIDILLPELTGSGPVPIVYYDIPALTAEARFGEYFFRIFGPFGLTLDGFMGATVDFQIGYDTFALETGNFIDGLYLTTQQMTPGEVIPRQPDDRAFEFRPFAHGSAGVYAGVAVDAFVVRVGVKGGVVGFAAAFLPGGEVEPPETPNGVLRLADLAGGCIFDPVLGRIGAEVIASIKIGFGFFSFTEEVTLAEVTLVDFSFGCDAAERELIEGLAHVEANELLLHVGPLADLRIIDGQVGTDGDETYRVGLTRDEDGVVVPGQLSVVYSAFEQRFGDDEALPDTISADFGDGNDSLDVEASVALAVTAFGGGGNDVLVGGAADDLLEGEDDNDRLFGNAGDDILLGGDGDDLLDGGSGADIIDGGADIDKVTYENSSEGVIFVFDGSEFVGHGGDAEGDRLISIEYIVGSAFSDVLYANPNEFEHAGRPRGRRRAGRWRRRRLSPGRNRCGSDHRQRWARRDKLSDVSGRGADRSR